MVDRAVHRAGPPVADRPRPQAVRLRRAAGLERRSELRGGDQRLHPEGAEPAVHRIAASFRVRGVREDAAVVEAHRRDCGGVPDRRHLRQGRGLRAPIGAGASVARAPVRPPERRSGMERLPRGQRSRGGPHHPPRALPLRDRQSVLQAGACDPRPRVGLVHPRRLAVGLGRGGRSGNGPRPARQPGRTADEGPAGTGPCFQLGAGRRSPLGHPSPAGGDGSAGGLLRAGDPDGGGPPRARLERRARRRRARGLFPRREPVRGARARTRLRLERDHRHVGQHRHVRRGSLPGRLPLPLQGALPADGDAVEDRQLDPQRGRHDARRERDPDRVRARPLHLLPRGRLCPRLRPAQRPWLHPRPGVIPAGHLEHQLRLQLVLCGPQPHLLLHVGLDAPAGAGHIA